MKKTKKSLIVVAYMLMICIVLLTNGMESEAADGSWKSDSKGWWYEYPDGTYAKNQWLSIDGKWYYFKGSGYRKIGWHSYKGQWYYFDASSGEMHTGWLNWRGKWYYFSLSTGRMITGWKEISGKWYYFNEDGRMATGWKLIGGEWYFLKTNGTVATGWKWIKGKCYYFDSNGVMQTDLWIDGEYVGSDGAWIEGYRGNEENGYSIETIARYDGISFYKACSTQNGRKNTDVFEYTSKNMKHLDCIIYVSEQIEEKNIYIKYGNDEGYRDIGDENKQYIPNYESPVVIFSMNNGDENGGYKSYSSAFNGRNTYMKGKGYKKYMVLRFTYCGNGKQQFDVYYKNNKLLTVRSEGKLADTGLKVLPNAEEEKAVLAEILKYKKNMTDLEIMDAAEYWYANHSYDDYTCWACHNVANIMKLRGYSAWTMACSKTGADGNVENDYDNYYAVIPKRKNENIYGHHISMVHSPSNPEQYYTIEVQGSSRLAAGETDFSEPWVPYYMREGESIYSDKRDCTNEFYTYPPLRDYNTVDELMKGDYGVDISKFDPFDCKTWY